MPSDRGRSRMASMGAPDELADAEVPHQQVPGVQRESTPMRSVCQLFDCLPPDLPMGCFLDGASGEQELCRYGSPADDLWCC